MTKRVLGSTIVAAGAAFCLISVSSNSQSTPGSASVAFAAGPDGSVSGPGDAAAAMQRAATLEAAGKYEEAADTYGKAAAMYATAGRTKEQAAALTKSAVMYEKLAGQLSPGTKSKNKTAAPAKATMPGQPSVRAKTAAGTVKLPPLSRRPGYIIGRAVFEDGRPIPQFSVSAAGYDGQVNLFPGSIPSLGEVEAGNGRYALQTKDTFRHRKPVQATVVSVNATASIAYRGHRYLLEMYPRDGKANGTDAGAFRGDSGKGVVRDFTLKMTGVRPGYSANEDTQSRYPYVYYGGVLQLDGTRSSKPGVSYEDATALSQAFPTGSVEITLTPEGPLLDGSAGRALRTTVPIAALRLGGNWRLRCLRNLPLGVYTATARLLLPGGEARPLHVRADILPTLGWQPSLRVTWAPPTSGSMRDMLPTPTLYLGQ